MAPSLSEFDKESRRSNASRNWIVGGKYREDTEKLAPFRTHKGEPEEYDFDFPATAVEFQHLKDSNEDVLVLDFLDGDTENPFNWRPAKKLFISALLCLMTLFVGLATTAYSSGIGSMTSDLGVSTELGQVGLFTFNFVCALAPLFLAPFCELVGRRVIYVGAFTLFTIMFIGLALGKNMATILVCRAMLGLFGSVGTTLVGGTFSDMYRPDDRAIPMATFTFVAIFGTVAVPIYAGFIDETIGWRWIEGIQGLANIPLVILVAIFLQETRGGAILAKRAKILRKNTCDERYRSMKELEAPTLKQMLHRSSIKAVHMLFTEPAVFAFALWIGFAWFVTFLFLSVIPITFQEKRGWSEGISGLPYISLCIGTTIGFATKFLQIRKYKAIMASSDRRIVPESVSTEQWSAPSGSPSASSSTASPNTETSTGSAPPLPSPPLPSASSSSSKQHTASALIAMARTPRPRLRARVLSEIPWVPCRRSSLRSSSIMLGASMRALFWLWRRRRWR
ncbi:major facilitator superfamily domain-containing protein [Aspergillus spectabilis]